MRTTTARAPAHSAARWQTTRCGQPSAGWVARHTSHRGCRLDSAGPQVLIAQSRAHATRTWVPVQVAGRVGRVVEHVSPGHAALLAVPRDQACQARQQHAQAPLQPLAGQHACARRARVSGGAGLGPGPCQQSSACLAVHGLAFRPTRQLQLPSKACRTAVLLKMAAQQGSLTRAAAIARA